MVDAFVAGRPKIELIKPDWNAPPNVRAFSTTRHHGFSQGQWSSLNLGGSCGDSPEHVRKNRELLQRMLPGKPPWLKQMHGNRVVDWADASQSTCEADAVFTSGTGQVCAVLTADCLPVLFCDKAGTKVAAAHAGWRGLAAGVLEATVAAMDCDPAELMAWMGPAIGPQAFEVGRDVYDAFLGLNAENHTAFRTKNDRWLANLYQLAEFALEKTGVRESVSGLNCTYFDHERFFSYRRDGQTGRMATGIWLTD
jgi:YfiH family protein